MFEFQLRFWVRALVLMFLVGTASEILTTEAEARAGRGRSSGRSSGFGSRPQQHQSPPQAAPSQNFGQQNPGGAGPVMNNNRGGFLRGMAGGLAGGFLGSMLFSSLGHAAGGLGGGAGGGIGLFEMILFAGLAYLAFRWWKNRQLAPVATGGMTQSYQVSESALDPDKNRIGGLDSSRFRALQPAGIDSDIASDIFFKVQGAWTRRDLTSIRGQLGQEIQDMLEHDLDELKGQKQINRLENITVRRTEVTRNWEEDGTDYSMVRFTANLLDYTVEETTGQVVEGSDTVPVKFAEDWIFAKVNGSALWKLVGIQQV